MDQCVEIVVIMKDEERTMRQKFLCYDELQNFSLIKEYIEEAKTNFPGDPESVIVKTTTVIQ